MPEGLDPPRVDAPAAEAGCGLDPQGADAQGGRRQWGQGRRWPMPGVEAGGEQGGCRDRDGEPKGGKDQTVPSGMIIVS
jgi:hypothetical protein